MGQALSHYGKMVMQSFNDQYGDNLYPGITKNVLILRDLVPKNMREIVFKELLEDSEYLEMLPAFPGQFVLTLIGYNYITKTLRE